MSYHIHRPTELELRRQLRNGATPTEKRLWQHLKSRRLEGHKFRRQQSFDAFVVDFYCPAVRLAIELDGASHDAADAETRDREREQAIQRFGVTFLRIRNADVWDNCDRVCDRIVEAVERLAQLKTRE